MFKYIGSCNSHPHNYYIDIAASLGLLGLILTILIFSIVIIKSITIIYSREKTSKIRDTLIPFFIIFFVEVFPIKTTGSFFTTTTGNFLFIIIAIVVGLIEMKKLEKDYEKK